MASEEDYEGKQELVMVRIYMCERTCARIKLPLSALKKTECGYEVQSIIRSRTCIHYCQRRVLAEIDCETTWSRRTRFNGTSFAYAFVFLLLCPQFYTMTACDGLSQRAPFNE